MIKTVFYSCVNGGPIERVARALSKLNIDAQEKSLFTTKRWRSLMNKGALGRLAARASSMGIFPSLAVLDAVKKERSCLIPTTNPFFLPHVLVAFGALHGRRLVPLVYDLYPDAWESNGMAAKTSFLGRIAVQANRMLFKNADAVVFIGARMARHAIERYGEPRRWTVIETGAECDEFMRADARLANRPWEMDDWLGNRVLISYSGNLGLVHDWETLALALKAAFTDPEFGQQAACLIAAFGPGAALLEKEWPDRRPNEVRFASPMEDDAWAEMLTRSSIAIITLAKKAAHTSIPSKTFSAMAAGNALLVIAPKASDLADIVLRHDCGIQVEPGDWTGVAEAIVRLVREPVLQQRLADNGRIAVREHYDMPALAKRWAEFLGAVAKKKPLIFGYEKAKRFFDLTVSGSAIVSSAPILASAMIAVRMTMGSPVFFRQMRPGLGGKPFELLKLRTMRSPRTDEEGAEYDAKRITWLGRFLRTTSLDEIPTFLNVIKGDMSLVGPRPLLMQYLSRYTAEQARRHKVKPGISGLAQVRGRNSLSWDEKFSLDIEYVDNRSLSLDAHILLQTAKKVFAREGISKEGHATMPEFIGFHNSNDDNTANREMETATAKCPVCDSIDFKIKKSYGDLKMGTCLKCGLAYVSPLQKAGFKDVGDANSSKTDRDYYDNILKNRHCQTFLAQKKASRMLDLWTEVSGNVPKSILEIGCGTGRYFSAFRQLGVNWSGIEINEEMLAYCIAGGIPARKIDISNDNISEKFDVVFMSQVLEHILEPKKFMQKIGAILSVDGVLHLDVPNHDSLTSLYRRVNPIHQEYGFVQPSHHLIAYTKKSLTTLLENAGFKIEIIGVYANDDDVFGQLMNPKNLSHSMLLALSRLMKRGSILAAVVKRK